MSLKENMTMVKEELSTEEQFFEQAVKTERFIKKYKKPLIGVAVLFGLGIAGTIAFDAYRASVRGAANDAFAALQKNPADAQAQQALKSEAPLLYDAWRMSAAIKAGDAKTLQALTNSASPEIADVSAYEAAALEKSQSTLDGYAYRQDAMYKDMALIDEAVLLLRKGKTDEAHQRLKMIDGNSPVAPLADALAHYGVK